MTRANRVTVVVENDNMVGTYWRTHKRLTSITSSDTDWTPDEDANATANRESFRKYLIDKANDIGIEYDPHDRRTEDNRFPSKWSDEETIADWAVRLASKGLIEWASKAENIAIGEIQFLGLSEVEGKDLQYANGNYAWASIELDVEITRGDSSCNLLIAMDIVSGQMRKPKGIGNHKWNYTGLVDAINDELGAEPAGDVPLERYTVAQLKDVAKAMGISGIAKMKRDELLNAIVAQGESQSKEVVEA